MALPHFSCARCGHTWVPRKEVPPKTCPNKKCNSPYWNKPRANRGKATVEDALIYATKAHKGQKDLAGLPYILHPIAVMLHMDTDEERILALCHDISEDTAKRPIDVAKELGMTDEWATWLEALTHKPGQSYEEYLNELKPYPVAVKVKLADITHNLSRLEGLPDKNQRLEKYNKGLKSLANR